MTETLLMVGARRGALLAAEALGLRVLLLDEPGRAAGKRRWARRAEVRLDGPREGVRRALDELCAGEDVSGVAALTERAVLAAAHAREGLGLPGTSVDSALACRDKHEMKARVRAHGIPCADDVTLEPDRDPEAVFARLGSPLVVKPRRSSGSRGFTRLEDPADLEPYLFGGWMAESYVRGVEMSVEAFLHEGRVLLTNPTEYLVQGHANLLPAPLSKHTRTLLRRMVGAASGALGVTRGIVHMEVFRTRRGPLFGELAARPPGGRLMELIERAYGFDPWRAVLELELGRTVDLPRRATRTAAAWILHPGAGTLQAVEGLERARAVPGVERVVCTASGGDVVPARAGTGEDLGWIEASGATRHEAAEALVAGRNALRFVFRDGDEPGAPTPDPG